MQTKAELELKDKQFEQVTAKPAPRWPWPELAVLAGYLGLVIIMTWPLALHFTEAVPDGAFKDRYQNLWNFWWVERAVTHFHNPLYTDMIFYPYYSGGSFPEMPLALYTLQVLNGLLMLPLTLTLGVGAAYNGIIYFTFTLSAFGAFLLARHLTRNFWAGVVAGIIYGFSQAHFNHINDSITNIMSIQWLPFYILSLQLWHEQRKWKWAGLAAVFLALCLYTDVYNTLYLLFYTAFFYLVTAWPNKWLKQLVGPVIAVGGGAILSGFLLVPGLFALRSGLFTATLDLIYDLRASVTLVSLFNPLEAKGALTWIGILVGLGLIMAGGSWRRAGAYWLGFFLLALSFTLGPKLQISRTGDPDPTNIPLPYAIMKAIPGLGASRAPGRFEIPAQLALAILVAFFITWLAQHAVKLPQLRMRPRVTTGLVCAAIAVPFLLWVNPVPLQMAKVEPAKFVQALPKTGDYAILELPITRHYNFDHERMLNQIWHERPIMGAYLSRPVLDPYREPSSPFNYLAEQGYVYGGDPNREIFAAQHTLALLDNVLKLYNFRYIVLYKEDYKFEKERQGAKDLVEKQLGPGNIIFEDEHAVVYKVPDSFWQRTALTPALFTGEGWYEVEQNNEGFYRWMNQQANLYLTSAQAGKVKLSLNTQAFGGDRTIRISANGQKLYEGRVTPAPQAIEFEFEVKPGTTELHLESLTPAQTAQELGLGQDKRQLAFLVRDVRIQFNVTSS